MSGLVPPARDFILSYYFPLLLGATLVLRVDSVVPGNFIAWSSTPRSDPAALSCSRPFTIAVVAKVSFIFSRFFDFFEVSDPSSPKDVVSDGADSNISGTGTSVGTIPSTGPLTSDPIISEI